jgi:hypothetical protein
MGSGKGKRKTPSLEKEVNGEEHYQTFYMQKRLTYTRKRVHQCRACKTKKDVVLLKLG